MEKKKRGNPAWVKGISGNPNGRPKNGATLAELVRQIGDTLPKYPNKKGEQETRTYKEVLAQRTWDIACYGDEAKVTSMAGFIRDTTEGRPIERHEIGGEGGGPITLNVVYDNGN